MKISTTLNFWISTVSSDIDERLDAMNRCCETGFEAADIGFGGCGVLKEDNWKESIAVIDRYKKKLGLEFTQSHLPFYVPECLHTQNIEGNDTAFFEEMLCRGIEASGMLGAKWAVYHPVDDFDADKSPAAAMKRNRNRLLPLLELAHKWGVGIAVENMAIHSQSKPLRRYCITPEELCELVDSFNDPAIGICWDTGHANLLGLDQQRCLRLIGKRLKAVHIQDNRGLRDDHLAPFMGNIDWPVVMKTIREIGYEGDLHFEAFGPSINLPANLKDELATLLVGIGKYLLGLADG